MNPYSVHSIHPQRLALNKEVPSMKNIIPAITEKSLQYLNQAKQAFQSEDYKVMIENINLALMDNNPAAEYWMACAYEYGLGVEQSEEISAFWLQKAADHGIVDAQFRMSQLFYDGSGIKQAAGQAFYYLNLASENNHPTAQYQLAKFFYQDSVYQDSDWDREQNDEKSYYWTTRAVENGNDRAQSLLALHHFYGIGTPEDIEKSLNMLNSLSQKGNLDALDFLAYIYLNGIGVTKDIKKSHTFLEKSAAQKNAAAAHQLGRDLLSGVDDIPVDYTAARQWLEYAAGLGYTDSLVSLGAMYFDGVIQKDYQKAYDYFKRAADLGNLYGVEWLGYCYCYGYGVQQDLSKSLVCYETATMKTNNRDTLYMLGMIYGYFIRPADDEKAAHYFLQAAQLGHPDAQLKIGFYYHHGQGIEQDYKKAFYWFEHSAQQGNLTAINNLGDAFYHGFGVKQNHQIAYSYFLKAANDGETHAMFDLGKMLYEGKTIIKDETSGLSWIRAAADKGNLEAEQWLEEHQPYDTCP